MMKQNAPLKQVTGHDFATCETAPYAGIAFRVDVLECGHKLSSSLGTSGYANPKRRRCYECLKLQTMPPDDNAPKSTDFLL